MNVGDLTHRQREFLCAIWDFLVYQGEYPTVRQLCDLLDINSPNGVMSHIMYLKKKGFVEWHGKHRGVGDGRPSRARCVRLSGVRMRPVFDDTLDGQEMRKVICEPVCAATAGPHESSASAMTGEPELA